MRDITRDRIGAASGAAFVALIFAGNTINTAGTSQASHPSGAQVLKDAAHQATAASATLGFVMEFVGFAAFIVFLGYLASAWRRRIAGGIVAGTAIVAAITMLAIKLGSAAPAGALLSDYKHLSPQTAQVLNDMNSVSFVLSWMPFAVFVVAAAAALRATGFVGKPTAYLGMFLGVAGLLLSIVGLNDPFNANPAAFVLGMAWLLVVSVRLAVKPGPLPVTTAENVAADTRVAVSA